MNSEAIILRLTPNKKPKSECQNSQIDILSIFYDELLKIEDMIPQEIKQKSLRRDKR